MVQSKGKGPLAIALSGSYTAIAELLLTSSADPNQADAVGECPLHIALNTSNTEMAMSLITKYNANPNPKPLGNGATPLSIVLATRYVKIRGGGG